MKDIEGMIDPEKDLDGISPVNIAKIFEGDDSGFAPCTAEAVIEVLKAAEIPVLTERFLVVSKYFPPSFPPFCRFNDYTSL